jgi:N4-gp56 family major capsid protein
MEVTNMPEITTYGDISPRTASHAAAQLLERGQHLLVTERFGQAKPLPRKHTQTVKFRRYESLARATAPLAEGITPPGQKLTKTDITAVLQQYGDLVTLTDVVRDTHEDPVLREAVDVAGEQVQETVEVIRISKLKAGSTVFYSDGVASRSVVNGTIKAGDLRQIVRFFNKMKARKISQIIKASAEISTEPVAPAFFAMCHTDLISDIRDTAGFVPVEQYSNSDKGLPGEVGKVEEIRFIATALFEPWSAAGSSGTTYLSNGAIPSAAANADVYPIIVVAQNAYGIVPLQGEGAVTPTVINPTPSKSDPLGQRGSVGWKTWQTVAILNQTWMARYEVGATAKP